MDFESEEGIGTYIGVTKQILLTEPSLMLHTEHVSAGRTEESKYTPVRRFLIAAYGSVLYGKSTISYSKHRGGAGGRGKLPASTEISLLITAYRLGS